MVVAGCPDRRLLLSGLGSDSVEGGEEPNGPGTTGRFVKEEYAHEPLLVREMA